ncbi:MAG TPA: hypothetical protein VGG46_16830 [Terriglobales bacterium]|jgi:hypothetical protein
MKRAFVLLIDPKIALPQDKIQGHLEDVETGGEKEFHSRQELVAFLDEILNSRAVVVNDPNREAPPSGPRLITN